MNAAPESGALFERACAVIPGGVNSPVRAFGAVGGTPVFMASGRSRHHRPTSAGSLDASICHAGEMGCAPGAGHPIRSQEQARPASPCSGWRACSPRRCVPKQTGQPAAA